MPVGRTVLAMVLLRSRSSRSSRWSLAVVICAVLAAGLLTTAARSHASTPTTTDAAYDAQQMYKAMNSERAGLGLPGYRWSAALTRAAKQHNYWMATRNVLSHQLSGEQTIGYRVTVQGYTWSAVGENIAMTPNWSLSGIYAVQRMMYNEIAPNDGHRRNIVSRTYRDVGIDIRMDATHGKAWVTQVFARLA